jgi:hypothetical protein
MYGHGRSGLHDFTPSFAADLPRITLFGRGVVVYLA